jgi:hypothetical protein
MDLYVFPSATKKNIEIGLKNGMWAIQKPSSARMQRQYATKAQKMPVGAHGLFYCQKWFTAPFIVASSPDLNAEPNLWNGEFFLPFHIHPLSDGWPSLSTADLKRILPTLSMYNGRWDERLLIKPNQYFLPSKVTIRDWEVLVKRLASIE